MSRRQEYMTEKAILIVFFYHKRVRGNKNINGRAILATGLENRTLQTAKTRHTTTGNGNVLWWK